MKSAAFNIAFKVHRNEVPFADGLLKSVEANAQEDFIEALNSLAGSTKYDINQLDALIAQARKGGSDEKQTPTVDTDALEEEIRKMKAEVKELKNSISFFETQNNSLIVTVIPGISSLALFLLGMIVCLIFFAIGMLLPMGLALLITIGGCVGLIIMDINKMNKQKEALNRKREKNNEEISKLKEQIDELHKKIREKDEEVARQKNLSSSTAND